MKDTDKKSLTLKTLNKSNVWDIQENDVFRMLTAAEKDADIKDNIRHYLDIIKSAFEVEEVKIDRPEVIKKYEARDFKIGAVRLEDNKSVKLALKKKAILRELPTSLTKTLDTSQRQNLLKLLTETSVAAGILYRKAYKISYKADST